MLWLFAAYRLTPDSSLIRDRPSLSKVRTLLICSIVFLMPLMLYQVAPTESLAFIVTFVFVMIAIPFFVERSVVPACNFGYYFRFHASPMDMRTVSAAKRGSSLQRPPDALYGLFRPIRLIVPVLILLLVLVPYATSQEWSVEWTDDCDGASNYPNTPWEAFVSSGGTIEKNYGWCRLLDTDNADRVGTNRTLKNITGKVRLNFTANFSVGGAGFVGLAKTDQAVPPSTLVYFYFDTSTGYLKIANRTDQVMHMDGITTDVAYVCSAEIDIDNQQLDSFKCAGNESTNIPLKSGDAWDGFAFWTNDAPTPEFQLNNMSYEFEVTTTLFPDNWTNQTTIYLRHTGPSLTDFPAYINVSKEGDMQADFDDLRFSPGACGDNDTILSYEIENYTVDNAHVWVKVPALDDGWNPICMRWGNPYAPSGADAENVWDSDFRAVYHMDEASGNREDSTSNNNDGTPSGDVTLNSTSKIDGGARFGEDLDYLNLGTDSSLSITGDITLEIWVYPQGITQNRNLIHKGGNATGIYENYEFGITKANNTFFFSSRDAGLTRHSAWGPVPVTLNEWNYIAASLDDSADTMTFYHNGVSYTTPYTNQLIANDEPGFISALYQAGIAWYAFNGTLDEARISDNARPVEWLNTTYQLVANQPELVQYSDPSLFYTAPNATNVTIFHASPDLYDFPIYLNVTAEGDMEADYSDLRFFMGSCEDGNTTTLSWELENYTAAAADVWVKLPLVTSANNSYCMRWGNVSAPGGENAADVWSSDYAGVFHLATNAELIDSTSNGNYLSERGSPNFVDGIVDGGLNTTSYADTLYNDTTTSLAVSGDYTTFSCFRVDSASTDFRYMMSYGDVQPATNPVPYQLGIRGSTSSFPNTGYCNAYNGTTGPLVRSANAVVTDGEWHCLSCTRDATPGANNLSLYLDGVYMNSSAVEITGDFSGHPFTVGGITDETRNFTGDIDEVRVASVVRDPAWINLTYQSVANQDSIVTFEKDVIIYTYPDDWPNSTSVFIYHASPDLYNFTGYINVTKRDGMQDDYDDLRFEAGNCSDDNYTLLNYEIENYTADKAHVWLQLPLVTSGWNEVCMRWGNESAPSGQDITGTWDSHFRLVNHFNDLSGDETDSTSYGHNCEPWNSPTQGVSGFPGPAASLDGVDQYFNCSNASTLNLGTYNITAEAWVKDEDLGHLYSIMGKRVPGVGIHPYFDFYGNNTVKQARISDGGSHQGGVTNYSTLYNDNEWHHLVISYDRQGSESVFIVDGVVKNPTTSSDADFDFQNTGILEIGYRTEAADQALNGSIDEARLAFTLRDPIWHNLTYQLIANQQDVVAFDELPPLVAIPDRCGIEPNATLPNNNVNVYLNFTENVTVDSVWFSNGSSNYTYTDLGGTYYNVTYNATVSGDTDFTCYYNITGGTEYAIVSDDNPLHVEPFAAIDDYCGIQPNSTNVGESVDLYLRFAQHAFVDSVWFGNTSNNFTADVIDGDYYNYSYTAVVGGDSIFTCYWNLTNSTEYSRMSDDNPLYVDLYAPSAYGECNQRDYLEDNGIAYDTIAVSVNLTGITFVSTDEILVKDAGCNLSGDNVPRQILSNGTDWAFIRYNISIGAHDTVGYAIYSDNPTASPAPSYTETSDDTSQLVPYWEHEKDFLSAELSIASLSFSSDQTYLRIPRNSTVYEAEINITPSSELEVEYLGSTQGGAYENADMATCSDGTAIFKAVYAFNQVRALNTSEDAYNTLWTHTHTGWVNGAANEWDPGTYVEGTTIYDCRDGSNLGTTPMSNPRRIGEYIISGADVYNGTTNASICTLAESPNVFGQEYVARSLQWFTFRAYRLSDCVNVYNISDGEHPNNIGFFADDLDLTIIPMYTGNRVSIYNRTTGSLIRTDTGSLGSYLNGYGGASNSTHYFVQGSSTARMHRADGTVEWINSDALCSGCGTVYWDDDGYIIQEDDGGSVVNIIDATDGSLLITVTPDDGWAVSGFQMRNNTISIISSSGAARHHHSYSPSDTAVTNPDSILSVYTSNKYGDFMGPIPVSYPGNSFLQVGNDYGQQWNHTPQITEAFRIVDYPGETNSTIVSALNSILPACSCSGCAIEGGGDVYCNVTFNFTSDIGGFTIDDSYIGYNLTGIAADGITLIFPLTGVTNTTDNAIDLFFKTGVDDTCDVNVDGSLHATYPVEGEVIENPVTTFLTEGSHYWNVNCTQQGVTGSQTITVDEYDVTSYVEADAEVYVVGVVQNITAVSNVTNVQSDADLIHRYMYVRNITDDIIHEAYSEWDSSYSISALDVVPMQSLYDDWDVVTDGRNFTVHLDVYSMLNESLYNSSDDFFVNSAPNVTGVVINPGSGYYDTRFECENGTTADGDGDTVTLTYRWFIDDVVQAGETSKNITLGLYNHSEEIVCEITPNDLYSIGSPVNSSAVTISNYAPYFAPYVNQSWLDNVTYTYDFDCSDNETDPLYFGLNDTGNFTINATGGITWRPNDTAVGDNYYLVSCWDLFGGNTSIEFHIEVNNTEEPPVFDQAIPDHSMGDGGVYTYDVNCSDEDYGAVIAYYDNITAFNINSSTGLIAWDNISELYVGNHSINITCGDGIFNVSDQFTIEINNTDPVVHTIQVTPSSPTTGDDLECVATYTTDVVLTNYSWYENGLLTGYTSTILSDSATDTGDNWSCCLNVTDSLYGTGTNCSLNVTVGGNSPPSLPIHLSPLNGTNRPCGPYFDWSDSTDAEGSSVTYELVVDDSPTFVSPAISISGLNVSYYNYGGCLANGTYYWRVQAYDGSDVSGWTTRWEFYIGPSCYDGIKNGDEIGVDCGGSCPASCPSNVTDWTNHCDNGYRDYWESDVDCGGSQLFHDACPPCGLGQRCVNQYKYEETGTEYAEHDNCDRSLDLYCDDVTMRCVDSVQTQCSNKILDTSIGETDIDCGGECGPCAIGRRCDRDHENCEDGYYCDSRSNRCNELPVGFRRAYSVEQGIIGTGKTETICPSHPDGLTIDLSEEIMNLTCGGDTIMHTIDFGERILTDYFDELYPDTGDIVHGLSIFLENGTKVYSSIPTLTNTSWDVMEDRRYYCTDVPLCDHTKYYYRYVVVDKSYSPPHVIYDSEADLGGDTATLVGPARHFIDVNSDKAGQSIVHHEAIFVDDIQNASDNLWKGIMESCESPGGETLVIWNGTTRWPSETCPGSTRGWLVIRLDRPTGMSSDDPDYERFIFNNELSEEWMRYYGVNPSGGSVSQNNLYYNYKIRRLAGYGDICAEKTETGPIVEEVETNDRRIGCMLVPVCENDAGISIRYQLVASTPSVAPFRKVVYDSAWYDADFSLTGLYDDDFADSCTYSGYVVPSHPGVKWGDDNIIQINAVGTVPRPTSYPEVNITNYTIIKLNGGCDNQTAPMSIDIDTDEEFFTPDFMKDRTVVGYEASVYELMPSQILAGVPEPYLRDNSVIDKVGAFGLVLNEDTPLRKVQVHNLCKDREYIVYLRYFTPLTDRTFNLPTGLDIVKDDTGGSALGYAIDIDYSPVGFFWLTVPHPLITRFSGTAQGAQMVLKPGEVGEYNLKTLMTPEDVSGRKARIPWVGQLNTIDVWMKNALHFVNPAGALNDMLKELAGIWFGPLFSFEDWRGIAGSLQASLGVVAFTTIRLVVFFIFLKLVQTLWFRVIGEMSIWMMAFLAFLILVIILKWVTYETVIHIITLGFR